MTKIYLLRQLLLKLIQYTSLQLPFMTHRVINVPERKPIKYHQLEKERLLFIELIRSKRLNTLDIGHYRKPIPYGSSNHYRCDSSSLNVDNKKTNKQIVYK